METGTPVFPFLAHLVVLDPGGIRIVGLFQRQIDLISEPLVVILVSLGLWQRRHGITMVS